MNTTVEKIQNNNNPYLQGNIEESSYVTAKSQSFMDIKMKLQEIFDGFLVNNDKTIEERIADKFLDLDFGAEFDVNADKIGVNDAIFFVGLLNQQNIISYNVENNNLSVSMDGKEIKTTNTLLNLLSTSLDTKKPIRLDFDNNVTVILKLNHKGEIQTHFLPGTAEVEAYLKNNLQCLKQAFDEQGINYSSLSYSKYKDNQQNQENSKKKRGNK